MKKLLITFAIALASTAALAVPDWVLLAAADTATWEGRSGTLTFGKTKGGKQIAVAEGRVLNLNTKIYAFEKWYVLTDQCRAGYGKVVTLNMAGEFLYETDFVDNGGSVASALADMLCYNVKNNASKGVL